MVRKSASVMLVVLLAGCTAMRQDKYCKWALPVWGAALGGTGGGLGVSKSGDRDAAETAGGAPHQHMVARLHGVRRMAEEHAIGGGKRQRIAGRLLPAQVRGFGHELTRLNAAELRE